MKIYSKCLCILLVFCIVGCQTTTSSVPPAATPETPPAEPETIPVPDQTPVEQTAPEVSKAVEEELIEDLSQEDALSIVAEEEIPDEPTGTPPPEPVAPAIPEATPPVIEATEPLPVESVSENSPYYSIGIIGQIEPVYVKPFSEPFLARIDTGAETSSIHAYDIIPFERDGKRWVRFTVRQRESDKEHTFECRRVSKVRITRQNGDHEERYKVRMEIRMGSETMEAEFSLANREDFEFQVLIGRNVLEGNAIVDVSKSMVLGELSNE